MGVCCWQCLVSILSLTLWSYHGLLCSSLRRDLCLALSPLAWLGVGPAEETPTCSSRAIPLTASALCSRQHLPITDISPLASPHCLRALPLSAQFLFGYVSLGTFDFFHPWAFPTPGGLPHVHSKKRQKSMHPLPLIIAAAWFCSNQENVSSYYVLFVFNEL